MTVALRGLLKSARCFLGATESRDLPGSGGKGMGKGGERVVALDLLCVCAGEGDKN